MPRTDHLDYYVSLRRGNRTALLAGPFATHTEALVWVDRAGEAAYEVDRWSWFDPRGTCSLPYSENNPIGRLNEKLGIIPRASPT